MERPSAAPDWLGVFTAAERPDLWQRAREQRHFEDLWPAYNHHGNNTGRYFGSLFPRHAELQVLFIDLRSDALVARGRTIPFRWGGAFEELAGGIDAVGLRAVDEPGRPTALSALAAEVDREYQRFGLSQLLIKAMRSVAEIHGLDPLLAPVRPSQKDRYPLTPIERYAAWRRDDGLPLDAWLRVHSKLGGRMVRTESRSLQIEAPVSDWESWTGMKFPEDGTYVFPAGLAPLEVRSNIGYYWEPNVWMLHEVKG